MPLQFLTAKIIDIGLVTVYYFVFGFLISWGLDSLLGQFNEDDYENKSIAELAIGILLQLFLLGVVIYALRNIVGAIPYPFEGFGGYEHARLKELDGGVVLAFVVIFFQKNLNDKIIYLKKRITGHF